MATAGLFDKVPAELRVAIYEAAFISDEDAIHLPEAAAPNKALIMTCHKIHNEAKEVYETEFRRFWSKKRFWITQLYGTRMEIKDLKPFNILVPFKATDINHITRLTVTDLGGDNIRKMDLMNRRGLWLSTVIDARHCIKVKTGYFFYKDAEGKHRLLDSATFTINEIQTALRESFVAEMTLMEQLREILWCSGPGQI